MADAFEHFDRACGILAASAWARSRSALLARPGGDGSEKNEDQNKGPGDL